MRLDQELVARGLCESRTEAQELIAGGKVLINNAVCTKQTKQVAETDVLEVIAHRMYVSRGGEKLEGVMLDLFGDEDGCKAVIGGKHALDVGSSTGGFTDYLLKTGAEHVDAVDVGTDQMHTRLRDDARVSVYEQTDIRDFKSDTRYDIVVADLSFISLDQVLNTIVGHGKSGAFFFLLIKPQFEVGKGNTKKGIVKDEGLVQELLNEYERKAISASLDDVKVLPCRIRGGDGNQEYFLVGRKQ